MHSKNMFFVPFIALVGLSGCGGSGWNPQAPNAPVSGEAVAHATPSPQVLATIDRLRQLDPGLDGFFQSAHGFAVFPTVGKGGAGIGGAYGEGEVYEQNELVGKATLTQLTLGFQLGGQAYAEIIFFRDRQTLDDFRNGNFELGAQASAVAVTAGASANAAYDHGVAVFTATKGGLMYEATVSGQKFGFEPVESGGRLSSAVAWLQDPTSF